MSDTPEHYRIGGVTPWDYCAAKFPESYDDHLLITAIEYISRAKHKAGAADIRKAYDNLGHWLKRNEPEPQPEPVYRVQYQYPGSKYWDHCGTPAIDDLARAKDAAMQKSELAPHCKWRVLDGMGQEILRVESKGGVQRE